LKLNKRVRNPSPSAKIHSALIWLTDARLSHRLTWFPRLWHGTPEERGNIEIIGDGAIIHWPNLDEDLSVSGLLAGRHSGESQQSLTKWLAERRARYQT